MTSHTITIFDGGTGREIERCGGPFRQPEWSCLALYKDPSIVQQVHEAFLESGAVAITTNTYAIVPFHIGQKRYNSDGKRLLEMAVRLAQQARDSYCERNKQEKKIQILGSIPPLCGSYEPRAFQEDKVGGILQDFLQTFCGNTGKDPAVDILLLETVGSFREAKYYLKEIHKYNQDHKKQPSLPIWLSFCVKADFGDSQQPTLLTGERISESIEGLIQEGLFEQVSVLMVNCCDLRLVKQSIQEIQLTIEKHSLQNTIQFGAYPNAFSIPPPNAANQTLRQVDYNISPEVMKCQAFEWIGCGATVIGGCCGVNPDHIRAMASLICQPVSDQPNSCTNQTHPEQGQPSVDHVATGKPVATIEIREDNSREGFSCQDNPKQGSSNKNTPINLQHQPPPKSRRATTSTVFVTGLAPAISRTHVEKMFQKFGHVLRVDVKSSNKTGVKYCFCELDSIENAQKAIDNLNGRMLLHKRLVVQPANERKEVGQPVTVPSPTDAFQESRRLDKKIDLLKQKIKNAQGQC
jgi:S-methylmethionine-dependent homocysteine/selenocysteine methylase